MRSLILVLTAFPLLAAAPAATGAPGLEAAFGNTIVSTHPDGRQAKLWLSRDGTWAAESRKHERSGGTWRLKGKKLCLTQTKPHRGLMTLCKTFPAVRLGMSWQDKAFNGDRVTNKVVAGR